MTPGTDNENDSLVAAYVATNYKVSGCPSPFIIRVGRRSAELAAMHFTKHVRCSAFLTAFNPNSVPQSDAVNSAAQALLEGQLTTMGFDLLAGFGEDPSGVWPGEPSVLVLGMSRSDAERIGREFGQRAVVWSGEAAVPELLVLSRNP